MLGLKIVSVSHFHGINRDLSPGTMLFFDITCRVVAAVEVFLHENRGAQTGQFQLDMERLSTDTNCSTTLIFNFFL